MSLTDMEKKILGIIGKQDLITKSELDIKLRKAGFNGASSAGLQKLIQIGYVNSVESLGNCFVLTQSGSKAFEDNGKS